MLDVLVFFSGLSGDGVEFLFGGALGFFCFAFLAFLLGRCFARVVGGDGGDVGGVYVDEGGGGGVIVEDFGGRGGAAGGVDGLVWRVLVGIDGFGASEKVFQC